MFPYQGSEVLMRNNESYKNESKSLVSTSVWGKSQINSTNTKDFFDVDLENSRSNF
jgi:hypothetical protein